jgi:hypothetical protein
MKRTLATVVACLAVCFAILSLGSIARLVKSSAAVAKPTAKTRFNVGPECCVPKPGGGTQATICHRDGSINGTTLTVDCDGNGPIGHQDHPDDTCGPCDQRDLCPNLAGIQPVIPEGYQLINNQCVLPRCEAGSLQVALDTYGFNNTARLPNGDLYLLGSYINLNLSTTTLGNGTIFSVNSNNFGPGISPLLPNVECFKISKPNSSLTAVSCQESFRNVSFAIAGTDNNDDTIRLSLQQPYNVNTQLLATFVGRGNGVVLTQLHPQASLFLNNRLAIGSGRLAVGAEIPYAVAIEGGALRTEQLTLELRGTPASQLETCAQLALDIMRANTNGTTSVCFNDITVNRIDRFGDVGFSGEGLLTGLQSSFPTDFSCRGLCEPCAVVAPVTVAVNCRSVCFHAPEFFLQHPNQLPNGSVLIGGVNFNLPVDVRGRTQDVLAALRGNAFGSPSPLQYLNRESVAAQLSWLQSGPPSSTNVLSGQLSCFDLTGLPVTLSNGASLSGASTLGNLFEQTRLAIINQRQADMVTLAGLFAELNRGNAFCH